MNDFELIWIILDLFESFRTLLHDFDPILIILYFFESFTTFSEHMKLFESLLKASKIKGHFEYLDHIWIASKNEKKRKEKVIQIL